ncbi:hypothetical protein PPL_10070 [Heterostelium album PN500]|uniref:Uncharacterized protein n=1 Tax=Heterostelium pallidum (strain ATCC 26659 / Pp 5 / PN500) TaxID=670386 RepID=D3BQ87_HETP5|nr:hypothetical protein PPL_10070 [Heterostelium album PN500]EFA76307.1 hypothetical protein PPL_10070 [Heterostelium album PN500]|eukprot:XP_020428439.1 hypothetical protein PPL_10070 [Heterostelium album PN500]
MSTTYTTLDKRAITIPKAETREKNSKKFTEYIIDIVVENGEEYKLVNKKVTLEDVSKKKITLEMTVAEGKDIKMGTKSMWDIVSYCIFDIDKQPDNSNSFIGPAFKSNTIPGPYPQWNYKQSIRRLFTLKNNNNNNNNNNN